MVVAQIELERVSLSVIEGGYVGLKPSFSLGPLYIGEDGVEAEFAGCNNEEYWKANLEGGEILCVYLLHFGKFIKIGWSSFNNVVARMLSQVPFVGVVAAVIELRRDCEYEPESIERWAKEEAEKIGFKMLKDKRCSLEELVELWMRTPKTFVRQLEKAEAEENPLVIEGMKEAMKIAVDVACVHGDLLYEPALHWFTTERRLPPLPPPLKEKVCYTMKKDQRVLIKPYPNGMLILESEWTQDNLPERIRERVCTLHEIRGSLFRVLL